MNEEMKYMIVELNGAFIVVQVLAATNKLDYAEAIVKALQTTTATEIH